MSIEVPELLAETYLIKEEIAERPSCKVHRAVLREDESQTVIVKFFTDHPGGNKKWEEDFIEETSLFNKASHPSLAMVLDSGCHEGLFYLVMEYIEGPSLRDLIKGREGPMEQSQAILLAKQLAEALEALKEVGACHGYLDTRAVLMDEDVPKIAGYYPGVIGRMRRSMTSAEGFLHEPAYIAPEQVSGTTSADYRSDIYSLSVILFEMVTGSKPFEAANPFQVAMLRVSEDPPKAADLNPKISAILNAAIFKGMSRNPEDRFNDFNEFRLALDGTGGKQTPELSGSDKDSMRMETETIGVGMSTERIQELLARRDGSTENRETSCCSNFRNRCSFRRRCSPPWW